MSVAYDLSEDIAADRAAGDYDLWPVLTPIGAAPIGTARIVTEAGLRGLATVTELRAPAASVTAPALRLTRRGVVVLAAAVAVLGAALVWLAALSAPDAGAGRGAADQASGLGAATVTVHDGDTLWAIAGRAAPARDPRAEVDHLIALNHLDTVAVSPGQVLRLR